MRKTLNFDYVFLDSSVLSQLGWPDMRLPILYTLSWPDRVYCSEITWPRLDLCKQGLLTFKVPNNVKYSSMKLAYAAGRARDTMTGVFSTVKEKAMEMFIGEKTQARESRIWRKMEELRIRYFGYQPLPTPIPVSPTFYRMPYEEVMEADGDYYQIVHFHYLVTSEAKSRNGLRLLVEEAITTEVDVAGIRPREPYRYLANEPLLDSSDLELTVLLLTCDKIIEEDVKAVNGELILCGQPNHQGCFRCNWGARGCEIWFSMRSKPSIPASRLVVSSDSEETSSSRRGNECSVMEETANSVGATIEVVGPNRSEGAKGKEDKREKEGVLVIYPEGVDVGKEYLRYRMKYLRVWGRYGEDQVPKPLTTPNKTSLFDCIAYDQDELTTLARVKELKGEFQLERERRAVDAPVTVEKFSELSKHDKFMSDAVVATLVEKDDFINSYYCFGLSVDDVALARNGRYVEIEFPSEEEEVAGDAASASEKASDLPPADPLLECSETVRLLEKMLKSYSK
ncbi:hypothetical protein GIB67_024920 [Kingdonia uniflora]|uniref:DXP reductoisomerase C-terminal domain-containing protein n=1 Tax=Kingdonia uniflora TaxID=39325 RepID=A0A7J7NZE0_9MAGN|nr:hypothetical protein GIB67_024920 [Kingdonia uniflora]